MIRIAYVINYIINNGPSNVVLNIIRNLDKSQYAITLITLFKGNDDNVVEKLCEDGIEVYECKSLNRMGCLLNNSKEFFDVINSKRFDIIHTHGFIPDILSSRIKDKLKKVTTIHNNMYEDYFDSYGYFKSVIFTRLHLDALKKLDECICCSKAVYDVMKFKLKNISYIRNGIELIQAKSIITREELNIPRKAKVFIYVGALNVRKNVVWLIDEFVKCHLNDEYLLILGQGEKEIECKKRADDHVLILGFKNDPIAYMNISDIYVSASKSEGFSISVLEALSCGLIIFLSDINPHKEIYQISNSDLYLGETFSLEDEKFNMKFKIIRKKFKLSNKERIQYFQKLELSDVVMAKKYIEIYRNMVEEIKGI